MTGGPGCSSEVALFGENGPCTVAKDGQSTDRNPFSWNANASLLYIDQPTGTGFSYGTGLDFGEKGVARDMNDFVRQFFAAHEQYRHNAFFIFGESYAGHYVPAVSHAVWLANHGAPSAEKVNLKGVAIGNGLTDPVIQYKYYKDMAISTNGHKPAVSAATHAIMEAATPVCLAAIAVCDKLTQNGTNSSGGGEALGLEACLLATDTCNAGLLIPYELTNLNPYDMRVKCAKPPLCYDFSEVGTFLGLPQVRAALGVGSRKWSDCNRGVAMSFELSGDWMHHYQQMLPPLLADGVPVLIYAGDQDYICNWLGNQAWTLALEWPHKAAFNAAPMTNWTVGGQPAGELRKASGFHFLRVFAAGHMVPRDQPANALAMTNAFVSGAL